MLKKVDGSNITLKDARDIARLRVDGFRSDSIQLKVFPKKYHLDNASIPDITDYLALKEKAILFENRVKVEGLSVYQKMIADPFMINYLLLDETGNAVGSAEWILPKYTKDLPFSKNSIPRKLYSFLLDIYIKIYSIFHKTNSLKEFFGDFKESATLSGVDLGKPHTLESLQKLDRTQLEKMVYPKQLSYFLNIICISSQTRGQGLGKCLLQKSIKEISNIAKPPPGVNGPAKIFWQSAPDARGFYSKLGYSTGPKVETKLGFTHVIYFANVD